MDERVLLPALPRPGTPVELADVTRAPVLPSPVSLSLRAGEVTGLIGPTGAGKTSLLRLIAGLDRPDAGTVRWDTAHPPRPLGLVPQDLGLWEHLSPRAHLAIALRAGIGKHSRRERRALTDAWLDRLGLAPLADRPAGTLSGGEKRCLAVARALIAQPPLLLLDEPFASLDYPLRDALTDLLREWHSAAHASVVIVSHLREDVLSLATHAVVMADARIVGDASPEALRAAPPTPFASRFLVV